MTGICNASISIAYMCSSIASFMQYICTGDIAPCPSDPAGAGGGKRRVGT